MKLYLIRHSLTEANERHLYCGSTDVSLSEEGLRIIAEHRRNYGYPDIEGLRIITSGMKRADETLYALFGRIQHETDTRLSEMNFGDFEMFSYDELKEQPEYIAWITDIDNYRIPNGESQVDFKSRVRASVSDIVSADTDTLVICHGGVIAAAMEFLFPTEKKNIYEWQPKSAEGYEILIHNKSAKIYKKMLANV